MNAHQCIYCVPTPGKQSQKADCAQISIRTAEKLPQGLVERTTPRVTITDQRDIFFLSAEVCNSSMTGVCREAEPRHPSCHDAQACASQDCTQELDADNQSCRFLQSPARDTYTNIH